MGTPRPWTLREVVTAARAILALEREAAGARRAHAKFPKSSGSEPARAFPKSSGTGKAGEATHLTAQHWGKSGRWLEVLLEIYDAAESNPDQFGHLAAFLDRGGTPNVASAWLRWARGGRRGAEPDLSATWRQVLVTPSWDKLSTVALAARALLAAAHPPIPSGDSAVVPIDHVNLPRRALANVANLWGEKADWLQKILDVCAAAEAAPEIYGRLVSVMDKSGRPAAACGRLKSIDDEARVRQLRPLLARFTTLVIDPPWDEDNISKSAGHDYAQMSIDEIRALPVAQWAEDDCHLWLWATNNTLPLGFELIKLWGFEHKAFHTWVKETDDCRPKIGLGREFRNSTEHVLFARRGSRDVLVRSNASYATPTHHRWPVGLNSEKPEGFYELVRACSYPRYGEAFQRVARPDFANLYVPTEAPIMAAAE
ncbi:MT-A70 family methyltransferase [Methylobacterium sp. 1973]|uniref:MT-A70 family methyltransferase n=1 Tax=Methylobacterium sp. 1973 TaxID=3156421 RepID=UPI00339A1110